MENTKIEWCDHSWSPWRGCTKVSPGCANCYAETLSHRNPAVLGQWGKGKPRVKAKNWNEPRKWNRKAEREYLAAAHSTPAGTPIQFTKPTVFPSLCDWLDEEVDPGWLFEFITLIHKTPNLTWLLLTKRPENFVTRLRAAQAQCTVDPLDIVDRIDAWISGDRIYPNVWVGTSVEDQTHSDERIPALLRIPARGRFLSLEPLLGPVDLVKDIQHHSGALHKASPIACLDWLIIGGESGNGFRPCNVEWIRSLVAQGAAAGVPTFVKQLGQRPVADIHDDRGHYLGFARLYGITHPKGGDLAEWPEYLRVRQFPQWGR